MTKDGQISYRLIFLYLSDGQYPPGFSKADKLGLRRRAKFFEAKGSDLYYCDGGENVHILCLKYNNYVISFLLHVCGDRQLTKVLVMPLRLVVEDKEQRRRIVSIAHEDGHFGVKRTYDTIASKYYWPGLFMNVHVKQLNM